jgi:hypothetical protein
MKLYHSGNDPFDAHPSRSKKSQFFALLLVESWHNVMIFAYSQLDYIIASLSFACRRNFVITLRTVVQTVVSSCLVTLLLT